MNETYIIIVLWTIVGIVFAICIYGSFFGPKLPDPEEVLKNIKEKKSKNGSN